MRGRFGLLKNANGIGSKRIGSSAKLASCSAFSTSSAGGSSGGGGGRGRGAPPPSKFNFVSSHSGDADSGDGLDNMDNLPPSGIGRGRGKPLASTSSLPSFNSFAASNQPSQQQGLGRGRGGQYQQSSESLNDQDSAPKRPIFLRNDEATGARSVAQSVTAVPRQPIGEKHLPESILNVLTGSGRGVPARRDLPKEGSKEENRHLRPRQPVATAPGAGRVREKFEPGEGSSEVRKPKMSRNEAVKNAVGILSRGDEEQGEGGRGRDVGAGRGRGRGRGRRRGPGGRGRGRGRRDDLDGDNEGDDEDDDDDVIFVGDDADGEKLAKALGPEKVNELTEAYQEMSSRVLPDPEEDEIIEALDINLKIELEPEYHFADFESNPDIDEKPPMPLHEALEKVKPFLIAYEGIESQEEWENAVKETMERVPTLKAIVDHYCGLDRVTAKQQQGELDRVAKTLPTSVPDSVKRFTDRAVLSLQSNPGWGFDRKCQFMDKLVDEFSKACK